MKMRMKKEASVTLRDGCNKYLEYCKVRNLRPATLDHYTRSYNKYFKYLNPDMPLSKVNEDTYNQLILSLRETLTNDVTVQGYMQDFIATMRYLIDEGYVKPFKMKRIRADHHAKETYTEDEIQKLLKKPDVKKCTYMEYQSWVISNLLFATGIRRNSMVNLKVSDIDFDNSVISIKVTKNRKPLLIPITNTLLNILKEFLKHRQAQNDDAYLFCNAYGQQFLDGTLNKAMDFYNHKRGVESTGLHKWRHTFAKQWILNGGNVVVLSRLLGHSSLQITQGYINLLVSDMAKDVEEINLLNKFAAKQSIKMR